MPSNIDCVVQETNTLSSSIPVSHFREFHLSTGTEILKSKRERDLRTRPGRDACRTDTRK